jgi:hypothetical protein
MGRSRDGRRRAAARAASRPSSPPREPPPTFMGMPCDLLTCLGPVASTPGYEREVDGTQRLCRAARDDAMLGAATADLRYEARRGGARSRLQYACRMNDHARVAWLVECGARDVRAAAQPGYAGGAALVRRLAGDPLVDATHALVAAAYIGVADVVAPLVARGAQLERAVDCGAGYGTTALQAATLSGGAGVVAALGAAGANMDAVDDTGWSALTHAAMRGSLQVAKALVAAGADVNRRDAYGRNAAALACTKKGAPVVSFLCRLPQAEPHAHIAMAAWLGDVQLVRNFIARGASVEERDGRRATCLALAAHRGHAEMVRFLLDAGADVAAVDGYNNGILVFAARWPAILAALLARFEVGGGALRQAQLDGALRTAMRHATPEGEECARMLRAAGAIPLPHVR